VVKERAEGCGSGGGGAAAATAREELEAGPHYTEPIGLVIWTLFCGVPLFTGSDTVLSL
jgi:hypothetical protein